MATNEKVIELSNRVKSIKSSSNPETNHIIAGADDIFDDSKRKKQSTINQETDEALNDRYTKEETYSKSQLNNMVAPQHDYITVATYADLSNLSEHPIGCVYRVSNYDGTNSQVDATKYSEYSWDGTQYIHLATKSQIGEVFDVSMYNATGGELATYDSLDALLSDDNLNTIIPEDVRQGGMRLQFVLTGDNKYVQFRYMLDDATTAAAFTNTDNWSFCGNDVYVENPEFVRVVLDNEGKILEATRVDGTKLLPAGVEINEKIDFEGNETTIIESPEFVEVKLDGAGHILWGIQKDGNIYFGAGVPQQVINYIEDRIKDLSLDEYEDIVDFLNGLEEGDKTLQELLNKKVDKEDGKSLIDAEYASAKSTIESPEFLDVTIDAEDKIIEGIKTDGTKVIGGDLNVGGSTKILGNMEVSGVSYTVIENPEYLAAWVDAEDKVLFGFKADGKIYVGDADFLDDIKDNQEAITEIQTYLANFDNLDIDALLSITVVENPKFIEATTDSEGKILAGRTHDGAAFENVGFSTPKVSIDGVNIENIEDPEERTEILTDEEAKIISYRDGAGVRHEEVGIESPIVITDNLSLSNKGMLLFQQALKDSGFNPGGAGDYSGYLSNDGKSPLSLPIPEFALINITNEDGNAVWPTSKTNNYVGLIEYYGMDGNFFRKPVIFNAQGNSSLGMPKKNLSIDLFDSEADGDVFSVRFGDWVPQDGFQMKAFYLDLFRCVCPISYKLARQIVRSRGPVDDAFWKREMLPVIGTGTTDMSEFTDYNKIFDSGAIGIPDGFPCIAFLNGEFYGVYSFQLKKHRDNYMMSKGNAGHIHLDGCIKDIFEYDGTIDWTVVAGTVVDSTGNRDGIEFRNPKNLVYAEAHNNTYKYDADSPGQFEIAGNNNGTSVYDTWEAGSYTVGKIVSHNGHIFMNTVADNTAEPVYHAKNNSDDSPDFKNKTGCGWLNVTNTVAVKSSFIALSTYVPELAQMVEDHATDSEIKAKIEEYFDVKGLIDYLLLSVVVGYETAGKNWQWITYDGVKWSVCPWDYDGAFGWTGWGEISPTSNISVNTTSLDTPLGYIYAYYGNVINERYAQLRQLGIFSVDNIWGLFVRWMDAVGADYYGKDLDKWPCDGEHYSGMSGTHYDNKYRLYNWLAARIEKCDAIFEYNN